MTPRVFIIDTNVFVAGLISSAYTSPPVKILDAMLNGSIMYVLSPALLQEYQTVLMRPKLLKLHGLTEHEINQLLSEITANAIWREPSLAPQAPDAGDDHLWALLLQTDDTILVTGDQLLVNTPPANKSVVTPATCLQIFFPSR
jgi:putative PIN family toxin of toxin-antitoxin system